jgi:hypothetical protein
MKNISIVTFLLHFKNYCVIIYLLDQQVRAGGSFGASPQKGKLSGKKHVNIAWIIMTGT